LKWNYCHNIQNTLQWYRGEKDGRELSFFIEWDQWI
jgi:hypothetical protein